MVFRANSEQHRVEYVRKRSPYREQPGVLREILPGNRYFSQCLNCILIVLDKFRVFAAKNPIQDYQVIAPYLLIGGAPDWLILFAVHSYVHSPD